MPVYEYQCKACGRDFEYQQRMSDPDKTVCEECGGALERLISRTAFTLKGGGWYKDLYSSAKPESKPDAKPEAASSDKGEKAPSTAMPTATAGTPSSDGGGSSSSGGSSSGGGSSTSSSIASAS